MRRRSPCGVPPRARRPARVHAAAAGSRIGCLGRKTGIDGCSLTTVRPTTDNAPHARASAASGNVRPVHDLAEAFVGGVFVPPDGVAADHAPLLLVTGVVGAIEGEVAQGGELGLDPIEPGA